MDNIRCPPLEVLLARNHVREKRPDHRHEVVILDEEDKLEVPRKTDVNLLPELRKEEHDDINLYLTLNDHNTAESSNNMSSLVDSGTPLY